MLRSIPKPPSLRSAERVVIDDGVLNDAKKIAERLHDALRTVFRRFVKDTTASGLARHSGVERTVCQRLVSALMNDPLSAETLTRIPGPKAIAAIAQGLMASGLTEAESLLAASEQLEGFFKRVGRSQRGYTRALFELHERQHSGVEAEQRWTPPAGRQLDAGFKQRTQLFHVSKGLVGAWSRVQVQIAIFAPSLVDPHRIDSARVRGVVDYHAGTGTTSLVFNHTRFSSLAVADAPGTFGAAEQVTQPQRSPTPEPQALAPRHGSSTGLNTDGPAVLEQFCSQPLPSVVTKAFGAHQQCFVVNPSEHEPERPYDIFLADQTLSTSALARQRMYRCDEVWAMVNYPTECLLLDVYLHTSLARMCLAGIDTHLWTPSLGDPMRNDRWATRLPAVPDLKILGPGLAKAVSAYYPRQADLVSDIFTRFGRNPQDFIGYRCEEEFPAWRVGYRLFLDYGSSDDQTEPVPAQQ